MEVDSYKRRQSRKKEEAQAHTLFGYVQNGRPKLNEYFDDHCKYFRRLEWTVISERDRGPQIEISPAPNIATTADARVPKNYHIRCIPRGRNASIAGIFSYTLVDPMTDLVVPTSTAARYDGGVLRVHYDRRYPATEAGNMDKLPIRLAVPTLENVNQQLITALEQGDVSPTFQHYAELLWSALSMTALGYHDQLTQRGKITVTNPWAPLPKRALEPVMGWLTYYLPTE